VENFTPAKFIEYLTSIDEIHFSEISILEAKAKIHRLSQRNQAYRASYYEFGENLSILREDDKIHFHSYQPEDDKRVTYIAGTGLKLDAFDMLIIAQATRVGHLLTEDRDILSIRKTGMLRVPSMKGLLIENWKETYPAT